MKNILFATNFTDSCRNALQYLLDFTQDKEVIINLIHVFNVPITNISTLPNRTVQGIIDQRKEASIKNLKELQEVLPVKQKGKLFALMGLSASYDIVDAAESIEADLIVMAMRENYKFVDRLIGSITAHTIERSKMPVLAIPANAKYSPIENVLFPTASENVENILNQEINALVWLGKFAKEFSNAKVHMIHINSDWVTPDRVETVDNVPVQDFTTSYAESIELGVDRFIKRTNSNLLAIYKPERNFWGRLFHSSVSNKIFYDSKIPLIVF